MAFFHTYTCTIPIAHPCAEEIEPFNADHSAPNDPNPLAFGGDSIGNQADSSTNRLDLEFCLRPDGDIPEIVAGIDFQRISGLSDPRCFCQRFHLTLWPDLDYAIDALGIGFRSSHWRSETCKYGQRQ